MNSGPPILVIAAALAAATGLRAQIDVPAPPPPAAPQASGGGGYAYEAAWSDSRERDDYREIRMAGGFRFQAPGMQLSVRGESALLLTDRETARAMIARDEAGGLPRRTIEPPAARRQLSPDELRERVDRTLRALGRADDLAAGHVTDQQIDLLRFLYFEGGVTVVRQGVEVLRCDRMWISPLDDRIVVENAEIRYLTPAGAAGSLLVVRGPRLVKQGRRWTGRDVTITTCTAAEPHAGLQVGETEIIERDGEFEVVLRGQTLQVSGTGVLPLPDARFFTGSQGDFPIKRAGAGYSGKEGARAEVVLGLPYNRTGGRVHEWLTGRPAEEFRGEWELGVGYIEKRGEPLDAGITYRVADLYEGKTRAFWLADRGTNLREITTNIDGSPIAPGDRSLITTENRLRFGPSTHLDLVAFQASDPAVLPEFFGAQYRMEEVPETSVYLHHADGNRLLTAGGRWNLDDFSYRDDRALAPRFVEEIPVVTYQWLAQPLGEMPWGTPIVIDLQTDLGQRRSDFDPLAPGVRVSDRTFRADQIIELSAPFHLGVLNVRPYAQARGTWYDTTVAGGSEGRLAFTGGVQIGTRLSRTWSWLDADGAQSVRHVIAPKVTYMNRFRVDRSASDFFPFDATDRLGEQELVRVELRNLLQRSPPQSATATRDFLMLDLAQDLWPDAVRDNSGDTLGLLYYDLLVRPTVHWLPVDTLALAVYGDYDWRDGLRTFDTEVQVGPIAGITWTADYREDRITKGAVGLTATTRLFDRWNLVAGSQRDLQANQWLSYTFGLLREDHDWSIAMSANYNPFLGETSFNLDFLPRFGGMNSGRPDRFGGGAFLTNSNFSTSY